MAAGAGRDDGWGTLIAIRKSNDGSLEHGDAIKMVKHEVTIGRLKDCDVAHTENKFLSSYHCKLLFHKEDGKIFVCDTSKNGTIVDNKKLKNEMVEISDGSIIRCVHKKSQPDSDVTYLFKVLNISSSKEKEPCEENNATQEYDNDTEEDLDEEIIVGQKRAAESEPENASEGKIPRLDSTCRPKLPMDAEKKASENDKEVEGNLTCGICQDIFHDCVSAQPCMHSFCAACYSQWMTQSKICPTCRKEVKQVGKNHIVNNLVAAFLKKHPDRERSKEELEQMDKGNKIKSETVRVGNQPHYDYSQDGSDPSTSGEYDDDDDDDDDDEDDGDEDIILYGFHSTSCSGPHYSNLPMLSRIPSALTRPNDARCRQCPNFGSQNSTSQSNSDSQTSGFTCSLNQVHILCSCCNQCFPDRRNTILTSKNTNAANGASNASENANMDIQCTSCARLFCHLYWGCRKPGCLGCLNKFEDFNFGTACLSRILNNNEYESNVLKDYLAQKSIGVIDLLRACVEKLKNKQFVVASRPGLKPTDVVCFSCGLRYFKELAYQYRSLIPNEELPGDVTRREDCYWGRNCRTQQHNSNHARRFNHICEQTRFTI